MNVLRKIVGKLAFRLKGAAETYEIDQYRRQLASCGDNVKIGRNCKIIPEHVHIGNDVTIGEGSYLTATLSDIYIGDHVITGPGVILLGGNHRIDALGYYISELREEDKLPENDQDIVIQKDVWIGQGAIILKGVTIGEGSVIGAGAVVTKSVPAYTIHVGSHDTFEKPRFTDEQINIHRAKLTNRNNTK